MAKVTKISHLGIATTDVNGSLNFLAEGLGLEVEGSEVVESDAVRVSFLPVGESRLELLEPVGEDGPVQKYLATRGPGIHHICLEVDDLVGMLGQLREKGIRLIDTEPRRGAHGALVAFVHPRSANGILIELVQAGSGDGHY